MKIDDLHGVRREVECDARRQIGPGNVSFGEGGADRFGHISGEHPVAPVVFARAEG